MLRKSFSHLTQGQRYLIFSTLTSEKNQKRKPRQKQIARLLQVHPSTICRELKRAKTTQGSYSPEYAHQEACKRKSHAHQAPPFTESLCKT